MLTLQFVSNQELQKYKDTKIEKLLNLVKEDNIIVIEGGLNPEEEAQLIKLTMDKINNRFKGIEIATLNPSTRNLQGMEKLRVNLAYILMGKQQGFTIMGPASIIKEIKKDPNKIQLLTSNKKKKNATSMRKM